MAVKKRARAEFTITVGNKVIKTMPKCVVEEIK